MSYDNWKTFLLSEVCDIGSSKRIYRDEYVEHGIPFYRSKEIIQKSKNESIDDPLFISREKFIELEKKLELQLKTIS